MTRIFCGGRREGKGGGESEFCKFQKGAGLRVREKGIHVTARKSNYRGMEGEGKGTEKIEWSGFSIIEQLVLGILEK